MSWDGYKEAARELHISVRTVGRWLASGILHAERLTCRTLRITWAIRPIAASCGQLRPPEKRSRRQAAAPRLK